MNTKILSAEAGIEVAVDLLKKESVVALPTETVYGLAANAYSRKAVAEIFVAKQRPLSDPLIVHLLDLSWLERVAILAPDERDMIMMLAEKFWPGPLTLLLPRSAAIPDLITAGLETVAVRIPSHPIMRRVLAELNAPLAAPSANSFGRISPTSAADVFAELDGKIPLILDGGLSHHGLESTILWPHDDILQILRPGPITAEMLQYFGKVITHPIDGKAPGSLKSHYAPCKKLNWYSDGMMPQKNIGLLAFSKKQDGFGAVEILSASGDLSEAACNLYAALRRLDASDVTSLVVEPVPEKGIGCAI
ncbi:MAG: L-threonylcarbamoyladenylate synthase, partial [Chthoniobacterales bacterium]